MTDDERLDELEARVAAIESSLERLQTIAFGNDSDIEQVRADVDDLRADLQQHKIETGERLNEVEQRTHVFDLDTDEVPTDTRTRAAWCLKKLHAKAMNNDGRAVMRPDLCLSTLNDVPHRTSAYDILETIPKLVPDEAACTYIREEPNSPRECRVELDLTKGDVPAVSEGVRIKEGTA